MLLQIDVDAAEGDAVVGDVSPRRSASGVYSGASSTSPPRRAQGRGQRVAVQATAAVHRSRAGGKVNDLHGGESMLAFSRCERTVPAAGGRGWHRPGNEQVPHGSGGRRSAAPRAPGVMLGHQGGRLAEHARPAGRAGGPAPDASRRRPPSASSDSSSRRSRAGRPARASAQRTVGRPAEQVGAAGPPATRLRRLPVVEVVEDLVGHAEVAGEAARSARDRRPSGPASRTPAIRAASKAGAVFRA